MNRCLELFSIGDNSAPSRGHLSVSGNIFAGHCLGPGITKDGLLQPKTVWSQMSVVPRWTDAGSALPISAHANYHGV